MQTIIKKRQALQTKIRTLARKHKDGSKYLEEFWNLVAQEQAAGHPFDPKASYLTKEYWKNPKTRDGKPTGDQNDVYLIRSKCTKTTKMDSDHKFDLHIKILHPKQKQVAKIYKFFEDMVLVPVNEQHTPEELDLVYRFTGTKKQFDILKRAVMCTMDILACSDFLIQVRGRQYDIYN
jgi:hypothetical protein